jgi:hypothetical protein
VVKNDQAYSGQIGADTNNAQMLTVIV